MALLMTGPLPRRRRYAIVYVGTIVASIIVAALLAQTPSSAQDLQLPAFITSRQVFHACDPSGTVDMHEMASTIERCLVQHDASMTLVVILSAAQASGRALQAQGRELQQQALSIDRYNEVQHELQVIDSDLATLNSLTVRQEQEEQTTPEARTYELQHAGTCEATSIHEALITQDSSLYRSRSALFAALKVSSPSDLPIDQVDFDAQAESFLKTGAGVAGIGKCEYGRRHWKRAVTSFKESVHLGGGAVSEAELYWLIARSEEKLRDKVSAMHYVHLAFESLDSTSDRHVISNIREDYRRLGAARADAVAQSQANASRAKAYADARAAFANLYTGDMKRVALEYGPPCHSSSSDNPMGHIEIWYYDCLANGASPLGRESFTFVNSLLMDHTIL